MLLKRRYITLLELMIVIAILAVVGGAAAFNIRKFYLEQQVLGDINRVVNVLNTATELMMLIDIDSEVRFSESAGSISVILVPQSGVPTTVFPLLSKEPILLSYLEGVQFKDGVKGTLLKPPFALTFESKGFLMNRGILQLKGNGLERYLVFRGYPALFTPLLGSEEYQEAGFKERFERITEQVRTLTMPQAPQAATTPSTTTPLKEEE
jgi:hypothetical protein